MPNLKTLTIGGKSFQVDALIADRLVAANEEYKKASGGKELKIASTYRSPEEQAKIRSDFGYTSDSEPSGSGGRPMAAAPNQSFHQSGNAVDISNWQEAKPYLNKYKLKNELKDDPGHFSVGETSKMPYADMADSIVKARTQGKSDTEILDRLVQKLPAFSGAIAKARSQGKNDSQITNQIALIYSGVGNLPVASVPVRENYISPSYPTTNKRIEDTLMIDSNPLVRASAKAYKESPAGQREAAQPSLADKASSLVQKGYEQFGKAANYVGRNVLGGAGAAIGAVLPGVTAEQGYNLGKDIPEMAITSAAIIPATIGAGYEEIKQQIINDEPINVRKLVDIMKVAVPEASVETGKQLGPEVLPMIASSYLGKIPSAILATSQAYEAQKDIRAGIKEKDYKKLASGLLAMSSAALAARGVKNDKGLLLREPIKNTFSTPASREAKIVSKTAKELEKIENNYVKLSEKKSDPLREQARKTVSEHPDLLVGSVDSNGKLLTKQKGGAISKVNEVMRPYQDVIARHLDNEGAVLTQTQVKKYLEDVINADDNLKGSNKVKALAQIKREINGMQKDANGNISLSEIHATKRAKDTEINYQNKKSAKRDKAINRGLKELVENNTKSTEVKAVNADLKKFYDLKDYLASLNGKIVKGGRFSKHIARLVGNMAGHAVGSTMGPFGSFFAGLTSGEAAAYLHGKIAKSTFSKTTSKKLEATKLMKEADAKAVSIKEAKAKALEKFNKYKAESQPMKQLPAPAIKVGRPKTAAENIANLREKAKVSTKIYPENRQKLLPAGGSTKGSNPNAIILPPAGRTLGLTETNPYKGKKYDFNYSTHKFPADNVFRKDVVDAIESVKGKKNISGEKYQNDVQTLVEKGQISVKEMDYLLSNHSKEMKARYQQELEKGGNKKQLSFADSEIKNQYQNFKDLRLSEAYLSKAEDLESFKKLVKERLSGSKVDDMFYSQERSADEMYQMFKDKLLKERKMPKGKISGAAIFSGAVMGATALGISKQNSDALAKEKAFAEFKARKVAEDKEYTPDYNINKMLTAIRHQESRGEKDPYSFTRFSGFKKLGDALGAYQVTEGELKSYAKKYLGRQVTRQEFLSNPKLQDEYMTKKLSRFQKEFKMTIPEAFLAHRGGLNADPKQYQVYVSEAIDQYNK